MSKLVEISPTTRHEGHSKLVLKVDDAGIIERGDWLSITPVRGVEKLAIGKTMDQVPKIASRVCGICPIAHTLAGIESMKVRSAVRSLRMQSFFVSFSSVQTDCTALHCITF